jgi:hypothetical protein
VHPNQIADWKMRPEGGTSLFGGPALGAEPASAVDLKLPNSKFAELTLEHDFCSVRLLRPAC